MVEPVYNCIIIDDEPIAIRVVKSHIDKIQGFSVVGGFTNALDAIKTIHNQQIDLIFLDIEMPGINGLEFIRSIPNPPKVIFTTAYRNYAAEAFDVDALDYLLKPIPFDRFLKAINKFLEQKTKPENKGNNDDSSDSIVLKSNKRNYKIRVEDILYIESLDDYIKVHTTEKSLVCYSRLSSMEETLASFNYILRVHRSFIVNTKKIKIFTHYSISIGTQEIPIGRSFRDKVIEKLEG